MENENFEGDINLHFNQISPLLGSIDNQKWYILLVICNFAP